MKKNKRMAELTWPEIENAFQENWLIVIPLGAACKEHGYHLPMNTDLIFAEKLADYIQENYEHVLVAPPITDNYYPAFVEYPGSSTLSLETATDLIVQRCLVWYKQGAKKFYIINNGVSTNEPLKAAKKILDKMCPDMMFQYLDLTLKNDDPRLNKILKQKFGTHADELETSMMMFVAPHVVDLEKAVSEDREKKPGPLTRNVNSPDKTISVSGAWGDPTLATREKGEIGVRILHEMIDNQLQNFGEVKIAPLNEELSGSASEESKTE